MPDGVLQALAVLEWTASQASAVPDVWVLIVPAVIAAVFGAVTGWLGAYLKVKAENYATREEFDEALHRLAENTRTVGEENARIARRAALDTELREAVRQFAVAAGGLIHSMAWLTWDCVERKRISTTMVTAYDQEVHRLSPTIVAQLAVIAMLDREVHEKLSPFADEIFGVDLGLSNAIVAEERSPESHEDALRTWYAAATDLEGRFRFGVANLFPGTGG